MIDEITGDIKVGAPLDRELIQVSTTISKGSTHPYQRVSTTISKGQHIHIKGSTHPYQRGQHNHIKGSVKTLLA